MRSLFLEPKTGKKIYVLCQLIKMKGSSTEAILFFVTGTLTYWHRIE